MNENSGRSICLIGMPGSGKSTVGVLLAKHTGLAFVDTDLLIQEQESATLAEIVSAKGQQGLLDIEEQVLLDMPIRPSVISTGGSVVYSEEVMNRLAAHATIIYLQARLDTVKYRISLAPDRGIASPGDQTIEDVFRERIPLYERHAELTIDVDDVLPTSVVKGIIAKLSVWLQT